MHDYITSRNFIGILSSQFEYERFTRARSESDANSALMHTDSKQSDMDSAYKCSGAKSFAKIRHAPLSSSKFRALFCEAALESHGIVLEFRICTRWSSASLIRGRICAEAASIQGSIVSRHNAARKFQRLSVAGLSRSMIRVREFPCVRNENNSTEHQST